MKNISVLFIIITLSCCNNQRASFKTGLEGKPLPVFNLLLDDSTTNFNTAIAPSGKPIVLLFFSPHCPFCRLQIKEIIKNIALLKEVQFYLLTDWPFSEMKIFSNEYQLGKYSNIVVGFDYNDFFSSYFKPKGVPFLAIYGKDKKLEQAFLGNISIYQIQQAINN